MGVRPDNDPLKAHPLPPELRDEGAVRPRLFGEYVGQRDLVKKLEVYVAAAKRRGEALDHCLFSGPPGLGKTSLAHIVARELGVQCFVTSGPSIDKKGDLAGLLTSLQKGDVLFIDEIHRLNASVEEYLYPAMEDFRLDILIDSGPSARAMKIDLPRFTLIGATTRSGLLTSPLRERFPIQERLEFYPASDLARIVTRAAGILGVGLDAGGADEIARRARGTPRIANRLLRRLRDFAEVEAEGVITREVADSGLARLDIDGRGLDRLDRRFLTTLMETYGGGPAGIETLAATLAEERDTLEDVVEPFLMQLGFLARTPRGRVATRIAWEHLGKTPPAGHQDSLL